jgi:alkylhydroperoxidase family enzyme
MTGMTFLSEPEPTPDVDRVYAADRDGYGFVMNLTHLWAHHPPSFDLYSQLLGGLATHGGLTLRDRGILITALASTIGDSYCATAWGWKLSDEADAALAAAVLSGTDEGLTDAERALARWARAVASDANGRTEADVQALRDAGYADGQVFAITAFVAFRMAFSTINSALGAGPDTELSDLAPPEVLAVIDWGRAQQ